MYKIINKLFAGAICFAALTGLASCDKENQNNLPGTSPAAYEGKIDGFDSSGQIFPNNLVAYWGFNNSFAEQKTGAAPTEQSNASLVDGGITGKSLRLNGGYLYYAQQFAAFKTDSLKSFTISTWVQILNNGTKKTMLFQIARPNMFNGNVDFLLETQARPASNTDYLQIHPYFLTVGGGRQDNINNFGAQNLSPKIGENTWAHILITYAASTGTFNIWGNAIKIGNYPNRGVGNNLFKSFEPNEIIIGGNYNVIPGKAVNADVSFQPMVGNVDEIRVYNTVLPDAFISALYKLGKAGK